MVWYPDQSRTKLIAKYSHRSPPHQSACFKHWAKLICQWFDTKTELDSLWFPTHYLIIAAENKDESKHTSKTFFNRGHRARRHSWTALGWRCRQQRDDKRMKKLSKESSIIFHWTITDHNENQTVRTSCDPNHYQLNANIFFYLFCMCVSFLWLWRRLLLQFSDKKSLILFYRWCANEHRSNFAEYTLFLHYCCLAAHIFGHNFLAQHYIWYSDKAHCAWQKWIDIIGTGPKSQLMYNIWTLSRGDQPQCFLLPIPPILRQRASCVTVQLLRWETRWLNCMYIIVPSILIIWQSLLGL